MYNTHQYDDIINLPHHISKKHPQMSIEARSAQFAPFAALTGYDDEVKETARLTTEKIELTEEEKQILNRKLQEIKQKIKLNPKITITYFVADLKKDGGKYVTIEGIVKKIDEYNNKIIMKNGTEIYIADIVDINEKT